MLAIPAKISSLPHVTVEILPTDTPPLHELQPALKLLTPNLPLNQSYFNISITLLLLDT